MILRTAEQRKYFQCCRSEILRADYEIYKQLQIIINRDRRARDKTYNNIYELSVYKTILEQIVHILRFEHSIGSVVFSGSNYLV